MTRQNDCPSRSRRISTHQQVHSEATEKYIRYTWNAGICVAHIGHISLCVSVSALNSSKCDVTLLLDMAAINSFQAGWCCLKYSNIYTLTFPCLVFYSCSSRKEITKAFLGDNPWFHHVILFITITLPDRWRSHDVTRLRRAAITATLMSRHSPCLCPSRPTVLLCIDRGFQEDWGAGGGEGGGQKRQRAHKSHLSLVTFDYFPRRNCLFCLKKCVVNRYHNKLNVYAPPRPPPPPPPPPLRPPTSLQ